MVRRICGECKRIVNVPDYTVTACPNCGNVMMGNGVCPW